MKGEPYNVTSSSKARASGDEAGWYVRRSEHTDGTFDEFWEKLGRNKAINAKDIRLLYYCMLTTDCYLATFLKQISPTQSIWTLHYHLIPPVSDRIFTVLQATHLEGGEHGTPREGRVISGPVDVSEDAEMKAKERKGVKGRYVSVLRLREGIDGGALEWMMATSSTPGGSIPQFITERTMSSQTFKDVPHFTRWLKEVNGKPSTEAKAGAEAPAGNGAHPMTEPVTS
ncbi:hypothetical protein M422DRAFT_47166 [Sphaerobolus stellatus SS14]|uniref:DUF3074 domain-containing protein n=1 Tax=Sphaerobolus stellatus (strain SS14) TaxID=990650 RepID=A0A0C9UP93_SPHS4|nr:hypothetical protein M422DRAFT_47166 [Sphaerobolus stellatus SS14]